MLRRRKTTGIPMAKCMNPSRVLTPFKVFTFRSSKFFHISNDTSSANLSTAAHTTNASPETACAFLSLSTSRSSLVVTIVVASADPAGDKSTPSGKLDVILDAFPDSQTIYSVTVFKIIPHSLLFSQGNDDVYGFPR